MSQSHFLDSSINKIFEPKEKIMEKIPLEALPVLTLKDASNHIIDWDLSPEDAVTLYLEWGNNNWHAEHPPVRSKDDYATYFVVDSWEEKPTLRLVRRNSEEAIDLLVLDLPQNLEDEFKKEFAGLKGLYEPTESIKNWLREEIYA